MEYIKIIGSNIRYERQKRNLTIEELSEIINVAPGFLGLIERGQRGTSIKNLCKIANFFSLTLDELITKYISNLEEDMVKEDDLFTQRKTTALSYVNNLDLQELEFLISSIKAFKKYTNYKYNEKHNNRNNGNGTNDDEECLY